MQSGGRGFQSRCPAVADPKRNPCAAAVIAYEGGPNKSRYSWDPLTTLVAVRSIAGVPSVAACSDCDGFNVIDPKTGKNHWQKGPPANQTYLVLKDAGAASDALDTLLCNPSKLNPHPTPAHPRPQPPAPAPPGMCELAAVASDGAGPPMPGFGGGNYTAAWDGDVRTFFDYSRADGGWTQASLRDGEAAVAHLEFYPRTGAQYAARAVGGKFVGVKPDGSSIELAEVSAAPGERWNPVEVGSAAAKARLTGVRFDSPDGGYGNVAEIKLYRRC